MGTSMKSITTSIRISAALVSRLKKASGRLSRGKNWILAKALEEYLNRLDHGGLAVEARRQSMLAAKYERGRKQKEDDFWEEDIPEWK